MHKSIFRKYSPMDLADMIRFMTEHPDLYVAVDAHSFSKNVGIEETYRVLVETAEQMGEKAILSRIIVNIYDVAEYEKVMAVYPFANVTMRQHGVHPNNYYELLNFCLDHNIHVVNVSQKFMEDEGIRLLEDHGIHIYTAVVDYISDMQDFKNLGASGAVSNFLREDDWQYIH